MKAKTIVGESNIRRQVGLGCGMTEFVAHVDEIGLAGTNAAGGLEGALNSEMSLVGMMSQRVNNEHLNASCGLFSGSRNLSAIRVVGKKPAAVFFKNKAICGHTPMGQLDRHNI
jgi:hypothetical protein